MCSSVASFPRRHRMTFALRSCIQWQRFPKKPAVTVLHMTC
jgi:hypothetical protein